MRLLSTLLFFSSLVLFSRGLSLSTLAATSLTSSMSSQLRAMLENYHPATRLGQDFLTTLSLKMKSGDKIDSMLGFIRNLKASLDTDQSADDDLALSKNTFWNNSIAELNSEIALLTEEIAEFELEIDTLKVKYSDYEKETEILNKELVLLDEKQANLQALREKDVEDYNKRVARQNNMIYALNVILVNLTYIADSGSFIEKRQVIDELKKVAKDNALVGLVALSTGFTPADLEKIIQKLTDIKGSLAASVSQDEEYETVALQNYVNLIAEFETSRSNVNNSIVDLASKMQELLQTIAQRETDISNDQAEIQAAQLKVDEYVRQQTEFNALYQKRMDARSSDLAAIAHSVEIVNKNSGLVRSLDVSPEESDISL